MVKLNGIWCDSSEILSHKMTREALTARRDSLASSHFKGYIPTQYGEPSIVPGISFLLIYFKRIKTVL